MQRVTKDQAIALKQIGYNVPARNFYYIEKDEVVNESNRCNYNEPFFVREAKIAASAPTLHEVCDWLRDTHALHVYVQPLFSVGEFKYHEQWYYTICISKESGYWNLDIQSDTHNSQPTALSSAITHALTIVKERIKQKI